MDTPTRAETPPSPDADAPTEPEARARRPGRRWPRRVAWGLLAAVLVLIVLTGAIAVSALGIKGDLDEARAQLKSASRDLTRGDVGAAADAFRQAEEGFSTAATRASGGLPRALRAVPILGRNLDVVSGAAVAGRELAAAGADLTRGVDGLPDGLGSLAPVGGRLPVTAISSLSADVDSAAHHALNAEDAIDATPSDLLVSPVASARTDAAQQVTRAATTLQAASLLLKGFPDFAGADGPKRYLLVAESPAELRGTGGIWGAYAVLSADGGKISVSPFQGALSLPVLPPDAVPAPNADYRRNYDGYGGAGSFRDLNMTPDFPSAAKAALGNYLANTGQRLDGVISADPFALQQLFKVTGPRTIPSLGVTIDAGNVVDYTTNKAYIAFARQGKLRKEVLGAVAGAAFQRFLSEHGRAIGRLKAIGRAASGGHLKVYSTDPVFEQGLRVAGADGALGAPAGDDLLSVAINNLTGSKIDYYVTRTVGYDVTLGGTGQAYATTTVTLRNDAPSSGVPGFVIDPAAKGYHPGDDASLVTASCPSACTLIRAARDGTTLDPRVGSELGRPWYQAIVVTPSESTGTLQIVTSRAGVWSGNSTGGVYRLRILPQTTVRPTKVTVAVHAPGGTRVSWTSEPMQVSGGTATWTGTPQGPVTLEVHFGASIPLSWWRDLTRRI